MNTKEKMPRDKQFVIYFNFIEQEDVILLPVVNISH